MSKLDISCNPNWMTDADPSPPSTAPPGLVYMHKKVFQTLSITAFILFSILSHHATTFSVTFYFKTIALNVYAFWIVHLKKHLENISVFFFFFPFLTEGNEQSSFNSSCLICSRITALLAELPTMRMDSTGHSSIYKALLELVSSRQN